MVKEIDVPFLAKRTKKHQVEMMLGFQGEKLLSVSVPSLVRSVLLTRTPLHMLRTSQQPQTES